MNYFLFSGYSPCYIIYNTEYIYIYIYMSLLFIFQCFFVSIYMLQCLLKYPFMAENGGDRSDNALIE